MEKIKKILAFLLVFSLIIPNMTMTTKAASDTHYLNAYASVRGIKVGESAEINSYVKNRSTNERVTDGITYTYQISDEEVIGIEQNTITAKKEGYAEIYVTATWTQDGVETTATDIIYVNVGNVKTESVLIDEESIANSVENIKTYDWAKEEYDSIVDQANYYAENYEKIYDLIASSILPRSFWTCTKSGKGNTNIVPTTGENIYNLYSHYAWELDPIEHPWKVIDPVSGDMFPSNDFGAYYESGLNEYGEFEPSLADASLLVNELYPEKGSSWGVDNGFTTTFDADTPGGETRAFIAYYLHWGLWLHNGAISATQHPSEHSGLLQQAITYLTKAYELTGDEKYSNAGAIILDRIADVYPELNMAYHKDYYSSDGGRSKGGAVGAIWETEFIETFAKGYDIFFEAYENEEVIEFLSNKANEYNMLNKKSTANEIRQNVEDGILREVHRKVRNCEIIGNFGMHQKALIAAAAALDTNPESKNWIDYMFQNGKEVWAKELTGGNIYNQLYSVVDTNGLGNEVSPSYNSLWIDSIVKIADTLDNYGKYEDVSLYKNNKVQLMFTSLTKFIVEDGSLNIGDTGTASVQEIAYDIEKALLGYQLTKDPVLAQLAYKLNGNTVEGLHLNIDDKNPESIQNEVKDIINEYGEFENDSTLLNDYGLYYLASGSDDTSREAWMNTSDNSSHGHWDRLSLGIYAYGIDMIPDLGYPDAATSDTKTKEYWQRYKWIANTISHNTVQMGRTYQASTKSNSIVKLFDSENGFQIMDVSDPTAYANSTDYRRTVYMVDIDGENSYYLDIFNADGENYQMYSTHALSQTIEDTSLNFVDTGKDSYANYHWNSTAFPYEYWVKWSNQVQNSGYAWLANPKAAETVNGDFDVTFVIENEAQDIQAEDGYRLKFTSLNGDMNFNSIVIADGAPSQKPGAPETMKYLLMERVDKEAALNSTYKSIYEPYQGESKIKSITYPTVESEDDSVVAIKVELTNGRIDYLYFSENGSKAIIDGKVNVEATYAMISYEGDDVVQEYVCDGTLNDLTSGEITGAITKVDENEPKLTLTTNKALSNDELKDLVGKSIYVTTSQNIENTYAMSTVERGSNDNEIIVTLADTSLIKGLKDPSDVHGGFNYALNAEDTYVIKTNVYSNDYTDPADYSKVEEALNSVPEDLTIYTDVTVEALNKAIDAIVYDLPVAKQNVVDGFAETIMNAIDALVIKEADYSKVDIAIEKATKLDKEEYENFDVVEKAINSVIKGLDITEQEKVDEMAKSILDAIDQLVKIETGESADTSDNQNVFVYLLLAILSLLVLIFTRKFRISLN